MLKSERESAVMCNQDGQGAATTEAGESPMETKHQANGMARAQAPLPGSHALPPTGHESECAPGHKPNANQQPAPIDPTKANAASVLGSLKAEPTARVWPSADAIATTESGSIQSAQSTIPALSGESSATNPALIPRLLDAATATPKVPIAPAQAKSSSIHGTSPDTAELPILGRGQHAAAGDRTNNRTRPLAPQPSNTPRIVPAAAPPPQPKGKGGTALRRGKWTVEEEAYVARVIQDFNSGFLNAPAGTTLRSYLSEKLQCDPMRITKKFTGDSCIGKRVFHPAVRNPSNAAAIDKAQAELDTLERRWRRRLEMQQRESAKKAAASAAAAAAASGRTHGFITQNAMGANVGAAASGHNGAIPGGQSAPAANGVTQTASWLDRASNILNKTGSETGVSVPCSQQKFSLTQEQAQALQSLPQKEIEMQMKEVERLIHEGPIIQQTTAGLPLALHQSAPDVARQPPPPVPTTIVAMTNLETASDGQQTPPEPADKRMRTGAEDAEALVGFLTAVRASAAAGTDSL